MAKITNRAFDALLTKLEQLADGAKKHAANANAKTGLGEAEIRGIKTELEDLREAYIQNETAARMGYDAFAAKFKVATQAAGNFTRMAKGALGPKAALLGDFGITPEKSKTTKKSAAAKANILPKAA